jgi:ribosomal protein S12 methylthiotransferase accessory factor
MTPHRSLSPDSAVSIARQEIERLGMQWSLGDIGPPIYPIPVCSLLLADREAAVGHGKGEGSQGLASAYYEALETYFISARSSRRLGNGLAVLLAAREVAAQPGLRQDLVIQRWAEEFPDSNAACVRYHGEGTPVHYPIFLSDPHYHREPLKGDSVEPYRSLLRYTSSLGTASGVNLQEALLHGLCELVEHDGWSHALLRWFIAHDSAIDVVDPATLPESVQRLYQAAANVVEAPVVLVDVTNDIGMPVYLAVGDGDDSKAAPFGAGASPLGEYAAVRALSELIQSAAMADRDADQVAAARLAAWPALQKCMLLPIRPLLSQGPRRVALRESVGDTTAVEAILETSARLVRGRGVEFYTCELTPDDSLVSVVTVIAPGLERFSLVHMGIPVIPTGRGWSLWTASLHPNGALSQART